MKRILALDTSTWWGGAALVADEGGENGPEVVAEIGVLVDKSHSAHLLEWIEMLLAQAGWSKSSLDLLAATRGPGSFTGIRVGLGTIRGLALATGAPCVGVGTLAALAAAHGPAPVERLALVDAGRGQLYGGRYDAGSFPPVEVEEPWVDAAERAFRVGAAPAVAVPAHGTRVESAAAAAGLHVAQSPFCIAGAAGRVAGRAAVDAPAELAPLYLRPPDALFKRQGP